jgi:NADH:ubiquinone oxidoreductase subunit 5 (subunit L)/multisubunit Na+/H+ antiporter MnhA subunit
MARFSSFWVLLSRSHDVHIWARLFIGAFLGATRSEAASHAHEAPRVMGWPLILLAIPSVLAGFGE